ncbi:YfhO family protein [Patescibacteria group bacterium]|nr:YfhO family protein [Patescibacteria group bacterium]MBU0845977.1 YfhO family protein [Patescibacteria group bacterium]MBU1066542.1 YfhO family protein [Patescibacteria group bacterium]MBU1844846.1 YfhO family protein [Patescibacteria group bacterium]
MKNNWRRLKIGQIYPFAIFLFITFIFFWKFFVKGLLPIPADIISGTYYPWLDLNLTSFPAGVPVKNPIFSDIVSIIYPWRELAVNLMKSGEWPLWNPYILSGTSLLANFQSAALYPLNIIYWLVNDFYIGWSLQVIAQPLLAAIFMFLFLREHKLSRQASMYGSLVWGFSGFMMTWVEYNTLIHSALYFPLMLFALKKASKNRIYYLLYSLCLALSFYAGYPQITTYILGFSLIYVWITRILKTSDFKYMVGSIILGVTLASPLLLPGAEASRLSIRQVDQVAAAANVKYIPLQNLITFIAPDYFGNPSTRNYWPTVGSYDNFVIFVGATSLFLFLISFWLKGKKKDKLLIFSWVGFFISLLLSFKNPIAKFIGDSNIVLISSSVMGRLALITTFSIAVGASISLERIIKGRVQKKSLKYPVIILIGLIIVPILISSLFLTPLKDFLSKLTLFNEDSLYAFQTAIGYQVSLRNLVLPAFMVIASIVGVVVLVTVFKKHKEMKTLILIGIFSLTLFDLYRFSSKYNSFSSPELLYPDTPLTEYLQKQDSVKFDRERGPILPPNMWMPYQVYSATGQDAIHPIRYNKFMSLLNGRGLVPFSRYVEIENISSSLYDFLGIENIVVIKWKNASPEYDGDLSWRFEESNLEKLFEFERTMVLKNPEAFPRMYPVENFVLAKTDEEFENLLLSTDLSKTVILETVPDIVPLTTEVDINSISFSPLITKADVVSEENSLLVISQTHFPGWKAYVDGKKVTLYRANYAFMAVPIGAGEHHLEIRYEPNSFKYGLIIGATSFIIMVSLLVVSQITTERKKNK